MFCRERSRANYGQASLQAVTAHVMNIDQR